MRRSKPKGKPWYARAMIGAGRGLSGAMRACFILVIVMMLTNRLTVSVTYNPKSPDEPSFWAKVADKVVSVVRFAKEVKNYAG